jgi:ABC-2 type transport system ATP-binding protein
MNALRVSGLSFQYNTAKALDNVSFEVREREIFGIVGPDSAGKTTLLRSLCTLLPLQQGDVEVLGMRVPKDQKRIRAAIGYMPQRFSLYQDLTVEQNLAFYARLFGVPDCELKQRREDLNRFSHLEPFAKRRAGALSGGMKQKLVLSCALIHTPRLLVLDEPTYGVDPVSRQELWKILHELAAAGISIIVSTAYMDEANQCGRVALLHRGRILGCDSPEALLGKYPNQLYRVTGSDIRAARDFLKAEPGVQGIQLFGGELHLSSPEGIPSTILDGWRRRCPAIASIDGIAPGMEDVFLEWMGDDQG